METETPHNTRQLVDHLFRNESGKMTAILTRIFGFQNSELIEDIVQDTFITAMKTWPVKDIPDNPSAWLMRVARNKTLNALKRKNKLSRWSSEFEAKMGAEEIERLFLDHEIKDSQLRVLVACCYPELPVKVQIMLTLKTIGGLSIEEIASAMLMSPPAVKKAVYRAKKEIQVLYDTPGIPTLKEAKNRLSTVYRVIYLMFNEGYKSNSSEEVIREDLCMEALRLAKLILEIPGISHGECHALISLMYFSIARFPARKGSEGEMIDIAYQGREQWDQNCIRAGFHHLGLSRQSKQLSKYHLESSIASVHCSASSYEDTDWPAILSLYEKLLKLEDSPVVQLNYAIALAKAEGSDAGLAALEKIDFGTSNEKLSMLHAARAEMFADAGEYSKARSYYQVACDLSPSKADQEFLSRKMAECDKRDISPN